MTHDIYLDMLNSSHRNYINTNKFTLVINNSQYVLVKNIRILSGCLNNIYIGENINFRKKLINLKEHTLVQTTPNGHIYLSNSTSSYYLIPKWTWTVTTYPNYSLLQSKNNKISGESLNINNSWYSSTNYVLLGLCSLCNLANNYKKSVPWADPSGFSNNNSAYYLKKYNPDLSYIFSDSDKDNSNTTTIYFATTEDLSYAITNLKFVDSLYNSTGKKYHNSLSLNQGLSDGNILCSPKYLAMLLSYVLNYNLNLPNDFIDKYILFKDDTNITYFNYLNDPGFSKGHIKYSAGLMDMNSYYSLDQTTKNVWIGHGGESYGCASIIFGNIISNYIITFAININNEHSQFNLDSFGLELILWFQYNDYINNFVKLTPAEINNKIKQLINDQKISEPSKLIIGYCFARKTAANPHYVENIYNFRTNKFTPDITSTQSYRTNWGSAGTKLIVALDILCMINGSSNTSADNLWNNLDMPFLNYINDKITDTPLQNRNIKYNPPIFEVKNLSGVKTLLQTILPDVSNNKLENISLKQLIYMSSQLNDFDALQPPLYPYPYPFPSSDPKTNFATDSVYVTAKGGWLSYNYGPTQWISFSTYSISKDVSTSYPVYIPNTSNSTEIPCPSNTLCSSGCKQPDSDSINDPYFTPVNYMCNYSYQHIYFDNSNNYTYNKYGNISYNIQHAVNVSSNNKILIYIDPDGKGIPCISEIGKKDIPKYCQYPVGQNGYITNSISYPPFVFQNITNNSFEKKLFVLQQLMIKGFTIIYLYKNSDSGYIFNYMSKLTSSYDGKTSDYQSLDLAFTNIFSKFKNIEKYKIYAGGSSEGGHAASGLLHLINSGTILSKFNIKITKLWLNSAGSMNCFTDEDNNQNIYPTNVSGYKNYINDISGISNSNLCPSNEFRISDQKNKPPNSSDNWGGCCNLNKNNNLPETEPYYDNSTHRDQHPPVIITSLLDSDYIVTNKTSYTISTVVDGSIIYSLLPGNSYWRGLSYTTKKLSQDICGGNIIDNIYTNSNSWCKCPSGCCFYPNCPPPPFIEKASFNGGNNDNYACSIYVLGKRESTHSSFTFSQAKQIIKFFIMDVP